MPLLLAMMRASSWQEKAKDVLPQWHGAVTRESQGAHGPGWQRRGQACAHERGCWHGKQHPSQSSACRCGRPLNAGELASETAPVPALPTPLLSAWQRLAQW